MSPQPGIQRIDPALKLFQRMIRLEGEGAGERGQSLGPGPGEQIDELGLCYGRPIHGGNQRTPGG